MTKKYYVVWQGREKGIFTTWAECKKQVDKFAGARYKAFPTLTEAESAFSQNPRKVIGKKPKPAATATKPKKESKSLSQEEITTLPFTVKIFTDGACEPNPGEAGSGLVVYEDNILKELWYGIYHPQGTNNTAELNGLHQAILLAKEKLVYHSPVAILSDSKYSIDCITKWADGWYKRGWVKSGGEIKNLELIKEIYFLYQELKEHISIFHVNGHVGIEGNELADRMSILAIVNQEKSLSLYRESIDIDEILALRAG
ncbi:viroplasmin family protein [Vibrio parahaemolyticus]|uniref:ribonuclease H1 domain-containing protein n=1 Tax=Vibrio parahaemolyticus TaxID=670 RepID=UPI001FABC97A|nr:viroplasmin family protein [Vibrio parahaemolyticus]